MQMGEITMVHGTDSVWGSVRGGVRREGAVGPAWGIRVRDNMVSRRIRCMRELYPCPNFDCIFERIIFR